MAGVIGVGGVFLACDDPAATTEWYARVLAMTPNDFGGFDFLHKDSAAAAPEGARTIVGLFDNPAEYFAPSQAGVMINLMVDDLDAALARAAQEGAPEVQPRQSFDYGQFGWIMDPDGRKVELWQPPG